MEHDDLPDARLENLVMPPGFFGSASRARLSLAVVNGETGIVASVKGRPTAVMVFYVRDDLITAVYAIADPDKLARLVRQ